MKIMTTDEIANLVDDMQVQFVDDGIDEDTAAELARKIESDLRWVHSRMAQAADRQRRKQA